MKADKLVYMANQIAAFFRAQPAAEAQTAVAEHAIAHILRRDEDNARTG